MRFTKMQGLGNDFMLVYGQVPGDVSPLCRRLCDRHFGAGADGVIFVSPSGVADARMRIFNADGSEAKMCGNGIRCVAKFLYDKGLVRQDAMTVETLSGIKSLRLAVERDRVCSVSVDMGVARVEQADVALPEGMGIGTMISVGNPHVAVFTSNVEDLPLYLWGPRIEHDARFPGGVNAEFVQVLSPEKLRMRVWERGCGITLACGTGACAAAVAAVHQGFCSPGRPIEVVLDGGSLCITVDHAGGVSMAGPAVTVYEGEIDL